MPSASCASTCTRCPIGPRACRTAPRTTTTPGASAWRTTTLDGAARRRATRCVIDSTLEPARSRYGECLIPRPQSNDEVLLSTHVCHPSLANDNLSGIALAGAPRAGAARARPRALVPAPVHPRHDRLDRVAVPQRGRASTGSATGSWSPVVGDPGAVHLQAQPAGRRRRSTAPSRTCCGRVAATTRVVDFSPYGYDERQFCSPGFDLPVGRIGRTPHGEYPEYHTSADDLEFVQPEQLADALRRRHRDRRRARGQRHAT